MKHLKAISIQLIVFCILFICCSGIEIKDKQTQGIVLVASTPGDPLIKSLLGINTATIVDFIRWDLALNNTNTFVLNINFGEGQPNTNGFKGGGEKLTLKGEYIVTKNQNGILNGEIYQLKPDNRPTSISFIKLNDNLFQLLTPGNNLMIGNGGWSYTLNRKEPFSISSVPLPALKPPSFFLNNAAREIIFEGRTPCLDASQSNLPVNKDCIKLKWKLTFFRDPNTALPTTYTLSSTLNRSGLIQGRWTIKRSETNPEAVICQLDPDKPSESISFLAGDENIIFFLNKNNQLLSGDGDFSFTLNKRQP